MVVISSFIPRDDLLWIIFLQLELLKAMAAAWELNAVQLKTNVVWVQLRWSHAAPAITFPLWLPLISVAKGDLNYTLKIYDLMKYK